MQIHFEPLQDARNLDLERYEVLLQMTDLVVSRLSLPDLFHEFSLRIQKVAESTFVCFILQDPVKNAMRVQHWEGAEIPHLPPELPVEDSTSGWVWSNQESLIIPDLELETRYPAILNTLRDRGVRSYCVLPMTTGERRLGAIGVGTTRVNAYGTSDVRLLERVAELIAIAVDNSLSHEALSEERKRLRTLVEISRTLASSLEMGRLLPLISECITRVVPHDFAGIASMTGTIGEG